MSVPLYAACLVKPRALLVSLVATICMFSVHVTALVAFAMFCVGTTGTNQLLRRCVSISETKP